MPLLKNVEINFVKCDPKKPAKSLDAKNKHWSLQVRTKNKETKAEWEALGIKVKPAMKDDPASGVPTFQGYWTANFSRKSKKADPKQKDHLLWEDNEPVEVIDGKRKPVDPTTIGNGTIANVRIYRREYKQEGVDMVAFTLMAIQVISLKVYIQKPFDDDFAEEEFETEVILPEESTVDDSDGNDTTPKVPTRKGAQVQRADTDF